MFCFITVGVMGSSIRTAGHSVLTLFTSADTWAYKTSPNPLWILSGRHMATDIRGGYGDGWAGWHQCPRELASSSNQESFYRQPANHHWYFVAGKFFCVRVMSSYKFNDFGTTASLWHMLQAECVTGGKRKRMKAFDVALQPWPGQAYNCVDLVSHPISSRS